MRRLIRLVSALLMLLVVAAGIVAMRYQQFVGREVNLPDDRLVTIVKGQTARDILRQLLDQQSETYLYIRLFTRLHPELSHLRAGTYELQSGMTVTQAMQHLSAGQEKLFSITLVEGLRWQDWRTQIQQNPLLSWHEFDDAAVIEANQLAGDSLEGWLLPDTYHVPMHTSAKALVEQALKAMTTYLEQAWAQRDADLPLATPYEALILASIIEKETAVAAERPEIAGVFVNRLRSGMRLQTDPTVIYGMGDAFDGNIRRADLRTLTPYNTYMIKGLPPTPIAMPSAEAINAALHPADTEAVYFVARGDGTHQFSVTLSEHQAAVRKYQLKQE